MVLRVLQGLGLSQGTVVLEAQSDCQGSWDQGRLSEDQGDDYRAPALAECSPGLLGVVPAISGVWA